MNDSSTKTLFICSFKNEEFAAPLFINELIETLNQQQLNYEIVLVDDGSEDHTAKVLEKFASNQIKVEILQRNVGKITAQAIGMKKYHTSGSGTVFFDGDGQHCAAEIASITMRGLESGQVVVGIRTNQYKRKTSTKIGTTILKKIFRILGIHLDLEKSELLYLPPKISTQLIRNVNFGVVPINSILEESDIYQELFPINIRQRFSNNYEIITTRHATKDLVRKAIIQLFYNPWHIISRIFLFAIIPMIVILAYGVFIGLVSIIQQEKSGIASIIVLMSFSTIIVVILQLVNIALTSVVHEKIFMSQSLKVTPPHDK